MKYKITKEQYSKLVYTLIEAFFKNAKFTKSKSRDRNGDYVSYDIIVNGEDVAWINSNEIKSKENRCKHVVQFPPTPFFILIGIYCKTLL